MTSVNQPLANRNGAAIDEELDPHSVHLHWLLLLLATLWTLIIVVVVFWYHVAEPIGVLSITVNGHTYTGNPPALTLFEKDGVSSLTIVIVPLVGLLVGAASLEVRTRRRTSAQGAAALIVGACLALFSLFGLLWGVASIGVVGALVILSARSLKTVHADELAS
ncbi:MAG TPA: hypothetical protein VII60_08435 [Acidimicrobiales bacterium]